MRIVIGALLLLGVVAAASAALLVKGLRAPVVVMTPATQPAAVAEDVPRVTVLYAAVDVPAMTVVDGAMVRGRSVPRDEASKDALSIPTDVVGKVIKEPVAAGQLFRKSCFYDESGSRLLAAVIPTGMRAVGIAVADYAGLEGVMFPGSKVDVMVSFRGDGQAVEHGGREAVTTTLLENVEVLAVEQRTVVSPEKSLTDTAGSSSAGGMRHVTLLADIRQGKLLQLGMQMGTLSLALRNPMDANTTNKEAIFMHNITGEEAVPATPRLAVAGLPATQPLERPHWDVIVLRGGSSETETFQTPTTQPGANP